MVFECVVYIYNAYVFYYCKFECTKTSRSRYIILYILRTDVTYNF